MTKAIEGDGKLVFNGHLWVLGVVCENGVVPDFFKDVIEGVWGDAKLLSKVVRSGDLIHC